MAPGQRVVATSWMAIARKGIELDFDTLTPMYLLGTAAITLARASPTGCFGKAIFPPMG
jgi:hypothetical protein